MSAFLILLIAITYFSPAITLIIPNGGEKWRVGSTQKVKWQADSQDLWWIGYTTQGYGNWKQIAYGYNSSREYDWLIPDTPSDNCRVELIVDWYYYTYFDQSDNPFSIYKGSLNVTSPNGGERWAAGSSHDITWETTGNIPFVRLAYSTNGGLVWHAIAFNIDPKTCLYSWQLPDVNSDYCYVKIADDIDEYYNDRSDNYFTIYSTGFNAKNNTITLPSKIDLTVSPNPVRKTAKISFFLPKTSSVDFCIYNMKGEKILVENPGIFQKGLNDFYLRNLSIISDGIYLLHIKTPYASNSCRFIKLK
ncbi:MAG: T9SS type A sorting domain-containing protein [Candidatus Coatesbacteria bacterium]|nr:T9SS type A sorting domain-containing protein [Candidatus Coatesbacteria bacterium]